MLDVLNEFRGTAKDSLSRHVARAEWLRGNLQSIVKHLKLATTTPALVPLLITSDPVPMQFAKDLPVSPGSIVDFAKIRPFVSSLFV